MDEPASSRTVIDDTHHLQRTASHSPSPSPPSTVDPASTASMNPGQSSEYSKKSGAAASDPTTDSTTFGEPCTTPKHLMKASELQQLRKPGDVVTTASGFKVRMVRNPHGECLFQSSLQSDQSAFHQSLTEAAGQSPREAVNQSSDARPESSQGHHVERPEQAPRKTPSRSQSSSAQPASRESSVSSTAPTSKKRTRGVTRLTSIDPRNIIGGSDDESERSRVDTPPTSSAPPSSYSFRTRNNGQSGLKYDTKYHPIDDAIRPSQAAKRRSLHGELQMSSDSDDSDDAATMCAESSDESDESDEEVERRQDVKKRSRPAAKGKKGTRYKSEPCEPTRRSSRQTRAAKVLYDMSVHPQDDDLIVLSSNDDDDDDEPVRPAKRKKYQRSEAIVIKSDSTDSSDEIMTSVEDGVCGIDDDDATGHTQSDVPEVNVKAPSPISFAPTPPPFGMRRQEGLDVWLLPPGVRHFKHDRDSWPTAPGQPFEIYESSFEEQMEAAASAASPLAFEDDDKENDMINPAFDEPPHPTDGMSVIPASQYRRTTEESNASCERLLVAGAFFQNEQTGSPYGLGVDGASADQRYAVKAGATFNAMSILRSGAQLPCGKSIGQQSDDGDSVLGHKDSSDSVLG